MRCTAHRGLFRCDKAPAHDGRHFATLGRDWLEFSGPGHDHVGTAYCTVTR